MTRNLPKLANSYYDLVIIGGGINGVSIARDAALRGLRVALVERGDFGSATSFNSLKIVHGGLRYLQHLNFLRMRESIYERMVLMRIAPHLVRPIPFLMPTYGYGMQSKEIMRAALIMNDLVGFDRNQLKDPGKRLPRGRVISKEECLEIVPNLSEETLTGGAIWYDCQLQNSERLLISILKAAVENGAEVANYLEVKELLRQNNTIIGAQVLDKFSGEKFDILAKTTVNASGPWVQKTLDLLGPKQNKNIHLSKAMNLVCKRPLVKDYAVGITSRKNFVDRNVLVNKGTRLFFLVPWRQYTLIGTTHTTYNGSADDLSVSENEIMAFVEEVAEAYPALSLRRDDISFVYSGLLPANDAGREGDDVSLQKRFHIYDHEREDRLRGLISVVGVKFTEARNVAEKAVDLVFQKSGEKKPESKTDVLPVAGGSIEQFDAYITEVVINKPEGLNQEVMQHLVVNYGTDYKKVLKCLDENPELKKSVSKSSHVIEAEVLHAVREEMAETLSDVVFRRTELAMEGNLGESCMKRCSEILAKEYGWDWKKVQQEIREVKQGLS